MAIQSLNTKAEVAALAVPASGQTFYWDNKLSGFGVRVTANGKKAYVVQARVDGKSRRVVVGPCTLLNPGPARDRATKLLTTLGIDGVDITAKKREDRATKQRQEVVDTARGITLRQTMEAYVVQKRTKGKPLKDSSKRDIRRHVENNFGDWADEPVANINRAAVRERFDVLAARAPQLRNSANVTDDFGNVTGLSGRC